MRYRLTAKDNQGRALLWCGPKDRWCLESQLAMKSTHPKLYGTTRRANIALRRVTKDQIHQVLVNLLMNAMDSLQGDQKQIIITTRHSENQVLTVIEDTGQGIAPENLEQIFEPFFSTKPEVEGTGLGLYVSYMIIKKHNGEIQVESEIGKGSTFTISLPIELSH